MVHFPWCCSDNLCIQLPVTGHDSSRVTPFGHLRVLGCVLLTVAFRSLPRPSSPDSPKAFTVNSYSLDHIYQSCLSQLINKSIVIFFLFSLTRKIIRFFRSSFGLSSAVGFTSASKRSSFVHLCLFHSLNCKRSLVFPNFSGYTEAVSEKETNIFRRETNLKRKTSFDETPFVI